MRLPVPASAPWGTGSSKGPPPCPPTAGAETLAGDLVAETDSSITATLENGSSLTGAIDQAPGP